MSLPWMYSRSAEKRQLCLVLTGQYREYTWSSTLNPFFEYITTLWDLLLRRSPKRKNLRHLKVKKSISINAVRRPEPVQADGETIGQTPVEIRVASGAIPVVVPKKINDTD